MTIKDIRTLVRKHASYKLYNMPRWQVLKYTSENGSPYVTHNGERYYLGEFMASSDGDFNGVLTLTNSSALGLEIKGSMARVFHVGG